MGKRFEAFEYKSPKFTHPSCSLPENDLFTNVGIGILVLSMNGATSLSMVINPKKAYSTLGFSHIAVGMLHNVIRGQGCALLAITVFLFVLGCGDANAFLLIAFTCRTAMFAHFCTFQHHQESAPVMKAIGSIDPLNCMIWLNFVITVGALFLYCQHCTLYFRLCLLALHSNCGYEIPLLQGLHILTSLTQ